MRPALSRASSLVARYFSREVRKNIVYSPRLARNKPAPRRRPSFVYLFTFYSVSFLRGFFFPHIYSRIGVPGPKKKLSRVSSSAAHKFCKFLPPPPHTLNDRIVRPPAENRAEKKLFRFLQNNSVVTELPPALAPAAALPRKPKIARCVFVAVSRFWPWVRSGPGPPVVQFRFRLRRTRTTPGNNHTYPIRYCFV